jgi:hypothetical protein
VVDRIHCRSTPFNPVGATDPDPDATEAFTQPDAEESDVIKNERLSDEERENDEGSPDEKDVQRNGQISGDRPEDGNHREASGREAWRRKASSEDAKFMRTKK